MSSASLSRALRRYSLTLNSCCGILFFSHDALFPWERRRSEEKFPRTTTFDNRPDCAFDAMPPLAWSHRRSVYSPKFAFTIYEVKDVRNCRLIFELSVTCYGLLVPDEDSYTYLLQLIGLQFSGLYRDRLRTESNTSKTSLSASSRLAPFLVVISIFE